MLKFKNTQKTTQESINVNQQAHPEYIISADEAKKLASKKWTTLPDEDIFKKIKVKAEQGEKCAYFFEAYINGGQLTQLKELGFTVYINTPKDDAPYFRVSW